MFPVYIVLPVPNSSPISSCLSVYIYPYCVSLANPPTPFVLPFFEAFFIYYIIYHTWHFFVAFMSELAGQEKASAKAGECRRAVLTRAPEEGF